MARITTSWETADSRFKPRVLVCARMSGVDGEDKQLLRNDLNEVELSIGYASEGRPIPWHALVAAKEVPVPPGSADLPEASRKQLAEVVHAANLSAVDNSDCLISHAWGNGSAALGNIQRAFLEGPFRRPVLVLLSMHNRKMSLEWEALEAEYCDLTIIRFGDDIVMPLVDQLREQTWHIEQSAKARQDLCAQWSPILEAIRDSFAQETAETQTSVARDLGRELASFRLLLQSPMQFASLPAQRRDRLIARYRAEISGFVVLGAARTVLSVVERAAWRSWETRTGESRAMTVLHREVAERERVGIYAPRQQRRTPGSWEDLAREFGL